jgi:hypothetical protein
LVGRRPVAAGAVFAITRRRRGRATLDLGGGGELVGHARVERVLAGDVGNEVACLMGGLCVQREVALDISERAEVGTSGDPRGAAGGDGEDPDSGGDRDGPADRGLLQPQGKEMVGVLA